MTTSADYGAVIPLIDGVSAHFGRKPREVSGDAGFAKKANPAALKERRIKDTYGRPRARHGEAHAAGRPLVLLARWERNGLLVKEIGRELNPHSGARLGVLKRREALGYVSR